MVILSQPFFVTIYAIPGLNTLNISAGHKLSLILTIVNRVIKWHGVVLAKKPMIQIMAGMIIMTHILKSYVNIASMILKRLKRSCTVCNSEPNKALL
jgi:hypothetical protein